MIGVKKIFRLCLFSAMILTALSSYSFLYFKIFFTGLFTTNPIVQKFAMIRMVHLLSFNFIAATYEVGAGALRGMKYSMTPAMLTVFGTCVLRIIWIYTVCRIYPGYDVLLNVYPVSWIVTGIAVLIAYYKIRKKHITKKIPISNC